MKNNEHLNTASRDVDPRGILFVQIFGALAFIVLGLLPFVVVIMNQVPLNTSIKVLIIYFCFFTLFWGLIWFGIKRGDPRVTRRSKFAAMAGFNFKANPEEYEGRDITSGSEIASGTEKDFPYSSLLNGTKNGHSFRVIDYGYWSGGNYRPYTVLQTVICIDLKPIQSAQFSIISRPLLERGNSVSKIPSNKLFSELPSNKVVVVDENHKDSSFVSSDFIHLFLSMDDGNIEYLKDYRQDRLLVYKLHTRLTDNDYFKWIDYAIALAEQLLKDHPV